MSQDPDETLEEVEELARRAATGADDAAMTALFERYAGVVYRWCWSHVRDRAAAEDIAQDTWLRVAEAIPHYRRPARGETGGFLAWLYRIAHRLCIDYQRRLPRVGVPTADMLLLDQPAQVGQDDPVLAAERRQLALLVADALDGLPKAERMVLVNRWWLGLDTLETAQVMGKSVGHVRVLQHRAQRKLRDRLPATVNAFMPWPAPEAKFEPSESRP